jgi:hypothetical protein
MNYTGNPRHLRSQTRSSHFRRLHRFKTPTISERPQLDICQEFQAQTSHTGSEAKSVSSSVTSDPDTFEAKRRRLLQQKDWLGLDISAPINVCIHYISYSL